MMRPEVIICIALIKISLVLDYLTLPSRFGKYCIPMEYY